jgi:hypothetical protein
MCECIQVIGKDKIHQSDCKEGFPNEPHKHAALIKAWADGATIQYKNQTPPYDWNDAVAPKWFSAAEYRIKPEPKPDYYVSLRLIHLEGGGFILSQSKPDNFVATFDWETGKLKSVEMIK